MNRDQLHGSIRALGYTTNSQTAEIVNVVLARQAVTESDAYGLIGQAVLMRGEGKHDIPAWFFDLAARIFLTLGNQAGADRCRQMAAAPTPTGAGDEGGGHA